jgi:transposase
VIQARQEDLPMSDQFWLTKAQLKRIEPFFPRTRGIPRVDDRRVVSGIVHVIRNGLRWRDAPAVYGPHKTLYNRFVRWSRMGIFDRTRHHALHSTASQAPVARTVIFWLGQ